MSIWFICEVLTRTSKRDHHGSDLGIRKQKGLSQVFKKSEGQWVLCIPVSEREASEQQTRSFATRGSGMVESSWCGALCATAEFRTPTTIIIFKVVTKPNMVGFVFLGIKLAKWHSYGWQDEKWWDKRLDRQSWIHAPNQPLEAVGVSKKFNIVQARLWVLIPCLVLQQLCFSTDMNTSVQLLNCWSSCFFSGSFASRKQQVPWKRRSV